MAISLIDVYQILFGRSKIKDGTVIEMAEHGRAGGVTAGQPFKFTLNVPLSTYIDEVSDAVTYVGSAKTGTPTNTNNWQIRKILVNDTVTSIQFADGDEEYDNAWDDRASLTYS